MYLPGDYGSNNILGERKKSSSKFPLCGIHMLLPLLLLCIFFSVPEGKNFKLNHCRLTLLMQFVNVCCE